MSEENRDPELQVLRCHWQPLQPSPALDQAVMRAYRRRFVLRKRILHFWAPMGAAVVSVCALGTLALVRFDQVSLRQASKSAPAYVVVRQPKLTVVSQGERP
jgi:hypothetical protein